MQERIIGAAVLVLVMVLVVPVFLDGPDEGGELRSERVPLPGQAEQETRTVVLDRDRTEPVPSNNSPQQAQPGAAASAPQPSPAAAQPEPQPESAAPDPAEEPVKQAETSKRAPEPKPEPETSATGMWAVQLGSFGKAENAERLAAALRKQGHAAFLSQVSTDQGQRHRVRIGPQKDRASANAVAARLAADGYEVQVLPHP